MWLLLIVYPLLWSLSAATLMAISVFFTAVYLPSGLHWAGHISGAQHIFLHERINKYHNEINQMNWKFENYIYIYEITIISSKTKTPTYSDNNILAPILR